MYEFKAWVFVGKMNQENAGLRLFLAWWGTCHCLKESRKEIVGACAKLRVPVSLSKSETQRRANQGIWLIGLGMGIWGLFLLRQRIKSLGFALLLLSQTLQLFCLFIFFFSHFWIWTSADSSLWAKKEGRRRKLELFIDRFLSSVTQLWFTF